MSFFLFDQQFQVNDPHTSVEGSQRYCARMNDNNKLHEGFLIAFEEIPYTFNLVKTGFAKIPQLLSVRTRMLTSGTVLDHQAAAACNEDSRPFLAPCVGATFKQGTLTLLLQVWLP